MKRYDAWFENLSAFIDATRITPYAVATNDCVHWCARAIYAMTGADVVQEHAALFDYGDAASMQTTLQSMGGLRQAVETVLGQSARGPNNARMGDLVYFHPKPDAEAVGICLGQMFVLPGDNGLSFIPMRLAEASWRVG